MSGVHHHIACPTHVTRLLPSANLLDLVFVPPVGRVDSDSCGFELMQQLNAIVLAIFGPSTIQGYLVILEVHQYLTTSTHTLTGGTLWNLQIYHNPRLPKFTRYWTLSHCHKESHMPLFRHIDCIRTRQSHCSSLSKGEDTCMIVNALLSICLMAWYHPMSHRGITKDTLHRNLYPKLLDQQPFINHSLAVRLQ